MPQADNVYSTQFELIEPFTTLDTWSEGLARIDRVGPCRRLLFFASDATLPRARIVAVKLILPAEALADIAMMLAGDAQQPRALAEFRPTSIAN